MIYLIITTSINNNFGLKNENDRKERYIYSINKTLEVLPKDIIPIIVENNGKRETYLDRFYHYNSHVKVFYTNNNTYSFKSKGINEFMDIKEVIEKYGIEENDIVIKLTGRYRMISSDFFKYIIDNENNYDAFIKFFGVCSMKNDINDCVMGCFALRAKYINMFNHLSIQNYNSAEIALARYVRFSIVRIKEIDNLNMECQFADDNRILKL